MINLPDNNTCVGCGVCQLVCPTKCISLKEDVHGFRQISIKKEDCINCLSCERSCPVLSRQKVVNRQKEQIKVLACHHMQLPEHRNSSSGGFFLALCKAFFTLYKDASVYGAVLNENLLVQHAEAKNLEEAKNFSGSKYLQSDISLVLKSVKSNLQKGHPVLFSGTPCQIGALYSYLKKNYELLYTCEVICHGVPSKTHFKIQNVFLEKKYNSQIRYMNFRSKKICWPIPMTEYIFDNCKKIHLRTEENSFMNAFYSSLNLRLSCYTCKYASLPRIADITMGDFWGYNHSDLFSKKEIANGISLVLANNLKADYLLDKVKIYLKYETSDIDKAIKGNRHLIAPVTKTIDERNKFLSDLYDLSLQQLNRKYCKIPLRKKIGIILGSKIMRHFYYLKTIFS